MIDRRSGIWDPGGDIGSINRCSFDPIPTRCSWVGAVKKTKILGRSCIQLLRFGCRVRSVNFTEKSSYLKKLHPGSCGRSGYTGPTGRTGSRHDPPDPSAYSTHTSLARLAS